MSQSFEIKCTQIQKPGTPAKYDCSEKFVVNRTYFTPVLESGLVYNLTSNLTSNPNMDKVIGPRTPSNSYEKY